MVAYTFSPRTQEAETEASVSPWVQVQTGLEQYHELKASPGYIVSKPKPTKPKPKIEPTLSTTTKSPGIMFSPYLILFIIETPQLLARKQMTFGITAWQMTYLVYRNDSTWQTFTRLLWSTQQDYDYLKYLGMSDICLKQRGEMTVLKFLWALFTLESWDGYEISPTFCSPRED